MEERGIWNVGKGGFRKVEKVKSWKKPKLEKKLDCERWKKRKVGKRLIWERVNMESW